MTVLLEGDGIHLRSSCPRDQQAAVDLLKATDCSLMVLGQHPERLHVYHPREDLFPDQIEERKEYRLMVENENGQLVGYVGFKLMSITYHRAELSYFIADQFKGRGYATRALKLLTNYCFNTLGMRRVYLEITEENKPSLRVAEKAGFLKEGLMKDYKFIANKWHNYWLLAKTCSQ